MVVPVMGRMRIRWEFEKRLDDGGGGIGARVGGGSMMMEVMVMVMLPHGGGGERRVAQELACFEGFEQERAGVFWAARNHRSELVSERLKWREHCDVRATLYDGFRAKTGENCV